MVDVVYGFSVIVVVILVVVISVLDVDFGFEVVDIFGIGFG